MPLANIADPYKLRVRVIAVTPDGERLESYSTRFLKVVLPGIPETEPSSVYNSCVRPIAEYAMIPEVEAWQKKMLLLEKMHGKARRRALETKSYSKTFAGAGKQPPFRTLIPSQISGT